MLYFGLSVHEDQAFAVLEVIAWKQYNEVDL